MPVFEFLIRWSSINQQQSKSPGHHLLQELKTFRNWVELNQRYRVESLIISQLSLISLLNIFPIKQKERQYTCSLHCWEQLHFPSDFFPTVLDGDPIKSELRNSKARFNSTKPQRSPASNHPPSSNNKPSLQYHHKYHRNRRGTITNRPPGPPPCK